MRREWFLVGALLAVMATLMWGAARQESATVDEPLDLATGYLFATGNGCQLNPEHPPLGQMLPALPWLFMDVKFSPRLAAVAELRYPAPFVRTWDSTEFNTREKPYPNGQRDWYYWPCWEGFVLGRDLLYGGTNNPDHLLLAGRAVQIGLTLLTGLTIVLWLRRSAGMTAAVCGLALWVFNPVALAHGHLTTTDISVTLMMTLAVWAFTCFLDQPNWRTAVFTGIAVGLALVTKFSALLLVPMFFGIALFRRPKWKFLPALMGTAWLVILLLYAPHWSPAPTLMSADAQNIGVPGWFQKLRPLLIPAEFFKGVALQTQHAAVGHKAFLCGEWRQNGWWYYFPLVLAWKLPVPLLLLTLIACARRWNAVEAVPWIAALVYFGIAMTSSINIGIRYLLPIFPLLAVGAATQLVRRPIITGIGCLWLAIVTASTYPSYIEYGNEFIGGTRNGYRYLADSNYDWGQDMKRLGAWSIGHGRPKIHAQVMGYTTAANYYGADCDTAALETHAGLLVISATKLMRPEWDWLRNEHQPSDRIGQTLFIYNLTAPATLSPTPPRDH